MTSQPKKKSKKNARLAGIVLGIVLAVACRHVPAEYQAACEAVSKITALSCGGV